MSDPLTISEHCYEPDRPTYFLDDGTTPIAVFCAKANPAWRSRLARVVQLEDIVRRALTVRSFHQEIGLREEMARLAAEFETCVCRRVVSAEERCPQCAACPSCEEQRPCVQPDVEQGLRDYEATAGVRY